LIREAKNMKKCSECGREFDWEDDEGYCLLYRDGDREYYCSQGCLFNAVDPYPNE